MPALHRLPANVLRNLATLPAGKRGDGGGLWLLRRPDGGAQWSFRYTLHGRAREMGLGSAADIPLADARRLAAKWRAVVASGHDPQKARRDERETAAKERPTFSAVATAAYESRRASLKNNGKSARWLSPIGVHVTPKLGKTPVEDIDQNDIRSALAGIWNTKPDAAAKALHRIRIIMKHAAAMGVPVDLQAADKAKALLGAQQRRKRNVPALPWREVPVFYGGLDGGTVAERALRFLILTACRSVEVRFAHVDEFDENTWIVPAARMKMGKEHRVPLSTEAAQLVEEAKGFARYGFLFPGNGGKPISDMTMNMIMRRKDMAERPHGFRASFRTWAAEATDIPREIAEACLAHSSGSAVERAYMRSDFLARRRALMARWATHVIGKAAAKVVRLAANDG